MFSGTYSINDSLLSLFLETDTSPSVMYVAYVVQICVHKTAQNHTGVFVYGGMHLSNTRHKKPIMLILYLHITYYTCIAQPTCEIIYQHHCKSNRALYKLYTFLLKSIIVIEVFLGIVLLTTVAVINIIVISSY